MVWGKGELPYQSSSCPHLAAQGQELLKERVPGRVVVGGAACRNSSQLKIGHAVV